MKMLTSKMLCVVTFALNSLLISAFGHDFYFGSYDPWQSPFNNWHKRKNPVYYDGHRSFHGVGHGHSQFAQFGLNGGGGQAERMQNDFMYPDQVQHPFGFFGPQLTTDSKRNQNDFSDKGRAQHPFGFFGAQPTADSEREENDFSESDHFQSKHADLPGPIEEIGGVKFVDNGKFPFSPLDVEPSPVTEESGNAKGEDTDKFPFSPLDVEPSLVTEATGSDNDKDTDYFDREAKSEFQTSDENIFAENSVEECEVDDESGTCLNIASCPGMLKLLKERPLKQSTIEFLNKMRCGFEGKNPKVCCSPQHAERTGLSASTSGAPTDVSSHPNLRLLPTECGPFDDPRILSGQRAGLSEFPWMVVIAYKSAQGIKLSCGGTLISSRYVLTAAHCVTNLTRLTLSGVIVGEHDLHTDPDCENIDGEIFCAPSAQNMTIEEVIPHAGYNPGFHNDIALIRLSEPADFQQVNIKPICLPLTNKLQTQDLTGDNATVLGWGATETGLQSQYLLKVALPVVSNKDCASIYKPSAVIWEKQMCAGGERDKDSCGGDSGGPLIYPGLVGKQVRYVQHGIVSFGHRRCGNGGFPGVYTRVAYYVDWILDNIRP